MMEFETPIGPRSVRWILNRGDAGPGPSGLVIGGRTGVAVVEARPVSAGMFLDDLAAPYEWQCTRRWRSEDPVLLAVPTLDSTRIVACGQRQLTILDRSTLTPLSAQSLQPSLGCVAAAEVSFGSAVLAFEAGSLQWLPLEAGAGASLVEARQTPGLRRAGTPISVVLTSPKVALVAGSLPSLMMYDGRCSKATEAPIRPLARSRASALAVHPNAPDTHVVLGTSEGDVAHYDLRSGSGPVAVAKSHAAAVTCVRFCARGSSELASCAADGSVSHGRAPDQGCIWVPPVLLRKPSRPRAPARSVDVGANGSIAFVDDNLRGSVVFPVSDENSLNFSAEVI